MSRPDRDPFAAAEKTLTTFERKTPRAPRASGLRAQILLGLASVSLLAVFSTGLLALWAAGDSLREQREQTASSLVAAAATAISSSLDADRPLGHVDNLHRIQPVLRQLTERSELSGVSVLGLDRQVIMSRPQRDPDDQDPAILQVALSGVPSVLQYRTRRGAGEEELLAFAPVLRKGTPAGAVRITMLAPAPVPGFLAQSGGPLAALAFGNAVLLVMLGYFVLTQMVVQPLRAIERGTTKISGGDLEERIVPTGPREIATLAEALNHMTASLAMQREQLIRSEKLASVGQLAAGIAHEIGNPLAAILGYADILRADVAEAQLSPEERQDIAGRVKAETQRIHRIIQDLLEYSRPSREEPSPTDPVAVLLQSRELLSPQARLRDVLVRLLGDPAVGDWPLVFAEPGRLKQVFVNLMLNAADAMGGKGEVKISCTVGPETGLVHLMFADEGPGVAPELRRKIFDPFFTTKDPGRGTGLGLSICRSIVETYGGALELVPTPDGERGARFVVALSRA